MADVNGVKLHRFQGVMTTLRQPRRVTPPGAEPAESLRQCAGRIIARNGLEAFQALAHQVNQLGVAETARHLADFDNHYRDMYREGERDVSPLLQFTLQLSEPLPHEGPLGAVQSQVLLGLAVELMAFFCDNKPSERMSTHEPAN